MSGLKNQVESLINKYNENDKNVKMTEIRDLIKKNHKELGEIKSSGKGRTKQTIINDLKHWINCYNDCNDDNDYEFKSCTTFKPKKDGNYTINIISWGHALASFLKNKSIANRKLVDKIETEYEKNGDFNDWNDVKNRVSDLKNIENVSRLFIDQPKLGFARHLSKGRDVGNGIILYTTKSDLSSTQYSLSCDVDEKFVEKIFKSNKHSTENQVDMINNFNCYGRAYEFNKLANNETRTKQKTNAKNGNIVFIAIVNTKGHYLGHGTGCLIDNQHVLTCAHNFDSKDIKHKCKWMVFDSNYNYLGCISKVHIPKCYDEDRFHRNRKLRLISHDDIAIGKLNHKIKSKFKYPAFGLSLKTMENKNHPSYVRIDGYPGQVGLDQVNGPIESNNNILSIQLYGEHDIVTKSDIKAMSFQTRCFITGGNSGGPVMLCENEKGQHKLDNNGCPIIVGIAVNSGGPVTKDSCGCVPMKPWTLAWISSHIGYQVNVCNQWVENQLICYMNKNHDKQIKQKTHHHKLCNTKNDDDDNDVEMK